MARNGLNVVGVISFHGGLNTFEPKDSNETITAKILVEHGYADSGIPPETVNIFYLIMYFMHVCKNFKVTMKT